MSSGTRNTGSWIMIILAFAALIALAWLNAKRQFADPALAAVVDDSSDVQIPSTTVEPAKNREAQLEPAFAMEISDSGADVQAVLPSGVDDAEIRDLLRQNFRDGHLFYQLSPADAGSGQAAWIEKLPQLLSGMLDGKKRSGTRLNIEEGSAEFSTTVTSQQEKETLLNDLKSLFPEDYRIQDSIMIKALQPPVLALKFDKDKLELKGQLPTAYRAGEFARRLQQAVNAESLADHLRYSDDIEDSPVLTKIEEITGLLAQEADGSEIVLEQGKLQLSLDTGVHDTDSGLEERLTALLPETPFDLEFQASASQAQPDSQQVSDPKRQPLNEILAVNFGYNSYYLTSESSAALDSLLERLLSDLELKILIEGHTDSAGDPQSNLLLSEQRAQSVKQYLVDFGIEESRLKVKGYGDKQPIASNASREGRFRNRRIEIREDKS